MSGLVGYGSSDEEDEDVKPGLPIREEVNLQIANGAASDRY